MLVGIVGLVGLLLGAAVAGRPQDVPSDIVSSEIQAPASIPSTTIRRPVTTPAATTAPTAVETSNPGHRAACLANPHRRADDHGHTQCDDDVGAGRVRAGRGGQRDQRRGARRTDRRQLRQLGYSNVTAVDAATDRADTVIFHVDGRRGEGAALAQQLGYGPQRVQPRPNESLTVAGEDGENSELWLIVAEDSL